MNRKSVIKNICILLLPLVLFFILVVPYSWLNTQVLVDWLGCGCPQIDEYGNIVENKFNANTFTVCFWLFITICVTTASIFLSEKIPRSKIWLRVIYVVMMFVASLIISQFFYQQMKWN